MIKWPVTIDPTFVPLCPPSIRYIRVLKEGKDVCFLTLFSFCGYLLPKNEFETANLSSTIIVELEQKWHELNNSKSPKRPNFHHPTFCPPFFSAHRALSPGIYYAFPHPSGCHPHFSVQNSTKCRKSRVSSALAVRSTTQSWESPCADVASICHPRFLIKNPAARLMPGKS